MRTVRIYAARHIMDDEGYSDIPALSDDEPRTMATNITLHDRNGVAGPTWDGEWTCLKRLINQFRSNEELYKNET